MKSKKRWFYLVVMASGVAGALAFRAGRVQAFVPQPDPPGRAWLADSGMLGMVRGQTARLSVVATDPIPTRGGSRRKVDLELSFFDSNGDEVGSQVIPNWDGKAVSLDVVADDLLPSPTAVPANTRVQIRAKVTFPECGIHDTNARGLPVNPFRTSLEVFDTATGKTTVSLSQLPLAPGQDRMGWTNHNETLVRDY